MYLYLVNNICNLIWTSKRDRLISYDLLQVKKVKEYVYSKILKLDQTSGQQQQLNESTNTMGNNQQLQNDTNNNYKTNEVNQNNYDKANNIGESSSSSSSSAGPSKDTISNAQRIIELICSDQVKKTLLFTTQHFSLNILLSFLDSQRSRDEFKDRKAFDLERQRRLDYTLSGQDMIWYMIKYSTFTLNQPSMPPFALFLLSIFLFFINRYINIKYSSFFFKLANVFIFIFS